MARKTNNAEILLVKKDVFYLAKEVQEIKTNHLVHIQAAVDRIDQKLDETLDKIYAKINSLRSVDDKSDLQRKLGSKIIEVIVLGVVTATLVIIGIKNL